jgi:hypothetical protein
MKLIAPIIILVLIVLGCGDQPRSVTKPSQPGANTSDARRFDVNQSKLFGPLQLTIKNVFIQNEGGIAISMTVKNTSDKASASIPIKAAS